MATITEFEKVYIETEGPTFIIGFSKRKKEWYAKEVNKKISFSAKNSFSLFDQLITYMRKSRAPNPKKFKWF